ncbi:hypothetical protein CM15mP35_06320 [bacterium]|nr:MAG: hypothetical protein CM15mP35_06320 [bacterium]
MFGLEQEYTFYEQSYVSLGTQVSSFGYPAPQGGYYCGWTDEIGRSISEVCNCLYGLD